VISEEEQIHQAADILNRDTTSHKDCQMDSVYSASDFDLCIFLFIDLNGLLVLFKLCM